MQDLRVTTVQTTVAWENIDANLSMFTDLISSLSNTDLVVLPELFSTGFTMNTTALAEPMDGKAVVWMRNTAARLGAVITGSLIIEENGHYYNRLVWMRPDGTCETYDKRHLFRMMNEHQHFSGGNKRLQVELKGWQIRPLVCYDLRFPVWSRQEKGNRYDLLVYTANWPEPREIAWRTLLMGRAHENQSYVVGVNRVGDDGNGVPFSGHSMVVEPKGNVISTTQPHETRVETVTLSRKELDRFREKFPMWMDADDYTVG